MFCYGPNELGAPTAENKNTLFDWQLENEGPKALERFGGVEGLVASLGSNVEKVGVQLHCNG